MSTTFQIAQDRVMGLLRLGGWSNSEVPPDPAYLVNWGMMEFIIETNYNQTKALIQTVANQAEYQMISDLPDFPPGYPLGPLKWLSWNDDALYNINPLQRGQGQPIYQWTEEKLREYDRMYSDCPASTPFSWYVSNDQTIGLYPPPATSGIYIQFSGNRELPPLVNADDTFPWMDQFTEAVCLYGAIHHGKPIARGEELQTLGRYMKDAADIVITFNQQSADKQASLINRRCAPPGNSYLQSGWGWTWPFPVQSTGPFGGQG